MSISPPPLKRRRLSPPPSPHQKSPILPNPTTPPSSLLKIYTWNINGLAPFLPSPFPPITTFFPPTSPSANPPHHPPSLRASLRRWSYPEILCLQELKLAPTDTTSLPRLRHAINAPLNDEDDRQEGRAEYEVWCCMPRDRFNARGSIYGVAVLVRRDVVRAEEVSVREVEWDLEGRVLVVEMAQRKLCVMGVYAVNGTANAYRDPGSGRVVGTRHDRKRAFHRLLRREVEGFERRGWGVVVAGDMNVARAEVDAWPALRVQPEHVGNRRDFEECFMRAREKGGLGMVDTFRAVRGGERKFTWRPRGRVWGSCGDRVDLVLVSGGLRGAVVEADILDEELERGPSDHVPLFLGLDLGRVGERGEGR